jgi:hypothetical protein
LLPIVRGDWLVATAWTSVDIEGIHGRYYQLAGIPSTFDEWRKQFGGNPALDERLKQKSVQISEVTGLWRTVSAELTTGVRPEDAPGLHTFTLDIRDSTQGEDRHALLNLKEFTPEAIEAIAPGRNGLDRFFLANGQGKRQGEAPFDVASWPAAPWKRKRLVAGISCIECHGGNSGLNPTKNVVLLNDRHGFAPIADLTKIAANRETQDILKSQYLGDLEFALQQRRVAYARKVDEATLGAFSPKAGEKEAVVAKASAEKMRIYRGYFARLRPVQLLAEAGYQVDEKLATAVLQMMLPIQEDDHALIRTIRNGEEILRSDVQKIFFEVCNRDAFRDRR